MEKYRILSDREEIKSMVNKAPSYKLGDIWQTVDSKRAVYNIRHIDVFDDSLLVKSDEDLEFHPHEPIYLRINFRNLIFKLSHQEFEYAKHQLSCLYPREAKAIEARDLPRTKLPRKAGLTVTLHSLSIDTALDITVTLDNLSERGIGITLDPVNAEFFHRNSSFQIIKVCNRTHIEYGKLTVRHQSTRKDRRVSIGLAFDRAFTEGFYDILREQLKKEGKSKFYPLN